MGFEPPLRSRPGQALIAQTHSRSHHERRQDRRHERRQNGAPSHSLVDEAIRRLGGRVAQARTGFEHLTYGSLYDALQLQAIDRFDPEDYHILELLEDLRTLWLSDESGGSTRSVERYRRRDGYFDRCRGRLLGDTDQANRDHEAYRMPTGYDTPPQGETRRNNEYRLPRRSYLGDGTYHQSSSGTYHRRVESDHQRCRRYSLTSRSD